MVHDKGVGLNGPTAARICARVGEGHVVPLSGVAMRSAGAFELPLSHGMVSFEASLAG